MTNAKIVTNGIEQYESSKKNNRGYSELNNNYYRDNLKNIYDNLYKSIASKKHLTIIGIFNYADTEEFKQLGIGGRNHVLIFCNICKKFSIITVASFLRSKHKCKYCFYNALKKRRHNKPEKASYTFEDLVRKGKEVHGDIYTYIGKDRHHNGASRIIYKCNICGHINNQLAHNHFKGSGCYNCNILKRSLNTRRT